MKEKKIYTALHSLTVYELNSFSKFLNSPFFNQNPLLLSYFEVLKKHLKSENILEQSPSQQLWAECFKGKYNNQKLRKANSDLFSLFEDFLVHKEVINNKQLKSNLKIKSIKDRKLTPLYPGIILEIEQIKKTDPNRDANYYLNQFNIEKSIFDLKTEFEKKTLGKDFESQINIGEISEKLDVYFIAEKLKYYCKFLGWKQMYDIDSNVRGIDIIFKLAQNPIFQKVPIIAIYYRISMILNNPEAETYYFELKDMVEENLYLFPRVESQELITSLLSYCISKVNKGQLHFQKETLDIYKQALKSDLLNTDGHMSPTTYRNIVFFALRVGEYQWVENFIYDHAKYLKKKYSKNALHFSLARLETYRQNYSKVIEHIRLMQFDDLWYDLNSRSLLLTAFFERNEIDALDSLLQSFRVFVSREKSLTTNRKSHYLNLIKFSKKLLSIPKGAKEKRRQLKLEIENTKGVVNKPWLLSKLSDV